LIAESATGIQRAAMRDQIVISQLGVSALIGAFEEERKRPQRLRVSLVLEPRRDFKNLADTLENTVDYDAVSRAVKSLAAEGVRLLVETLAEDIAAHLLAHYPLAAVEVEVRKYILPDTEFVAVRLRREA
jgi:dihydroneopterin aldolase